MNPGPARLPLLSSSAIWDTLYSGSRAPYGAREGRLFPTVGRRGITVAAISGIDIALWDIAGQALGVPVWRLLGGKYRDRVPAYASGGWAPVGGIGKQLAQYVERGHRAVKMRVGLQPDLAIAGGLTECQRICALAAAHELTVAPHLWGSAILFAAGLHLCVATPCATIVEFSRGENPLLHELVEEPFALKDGAVLAPEKPGLGLTLRRDFVRSIAVA